MVMSVWSRRGLVHLLLTALKLLQGADGVLLLQVGLLFNLVLPAVVELDSVSSPPPGMLQALLGLLS